MWVGLVRPIKLTENQNRTEALNKRELCLPDARSWGVRFSCLWIQTETLALLGLGACWLSNQSLRHVLVGGGH